MTIDVKFNDHGRYSQEKSDYGYSNERLIDLREHVLQKSCCRNLPKAPRCGTYSVVCRECGFTALVTVAGRADDPRSITMACKVKVH